MSIQENVQIVKDFSSAMGSGNSKVTNIREYLDTQALARASEMDASPASSNA
jgi:ketosteroid isomerase-like protein